MAAGADPTDDVIFGEYFIDEEVMPSDDICVGARAYIISQRISDSWVGWGALVFREPIFNCVGDVMCCMKC